MPRLIVKLNDGHKDWYMEWTTVADGPYTYGMNLETFRTYYLETYGTKSENELNERLARVEQKGTSSMLHNSGDDVIKFNRCGKGETILTKQQIIDLYCTQTLSFSDLPEGTRLENKEDEDL